MLGHITNELLDAGLLARDARHVVNVFFTTGDSFHVHVHSSDGRYWHIKASEEFDLRPEFERFQCAYADLAHAVPEPIAYVNRPRINFIVAQGIESKPASLRDLIVRRKITKYGRELVAILRSLAKPVSSSQEAPHDALLQTLRQSLAHSRLEAGFRFWGQQENLDIVAALPSCRQHGDFTINNLATNRDRLILFDFEDYDRVRLPGFDLAVWYASATNFDVQRMRAIFWSRDIGGDVLSPLLSAGCAAIGIAPGAFSAMLPLHLMVFFMLKANYSGRIRQTVETVVEQILSA